MLGEKASRDACRLSSAGAGAGAGGYRGITYDEVSSFRVRGVWQVRFGSFRATRQQDLIPSGPELINAACTVKSSEGRVFVSSCRMSWAQFYLKRQAGWGSGELTERVEGGACAPGNQRVQPCSQRASKVTPLRDWAKGYLKFPSSPTEPSTDEPGQPCQTHAANSLDKRTKKVYCV